MVHGRYVFPASLRTQPRYANGFSPFRELIGGVILRFGKIPPAVGPEDNLQMGSKQTLTGQPGLSAIVEAAWHGPCNLGG